jgi:hypothetical protein
MMMMIIVVVVVATVTMIMTLTSSQVTRIGLIPNIVTHLVELFID